MSSQSSHQKICSLLAVVASFILFTSASVNGDRSTRTNGQAGKFKSPCGTANELTVRFGKCMEPMFELVEGRWVGGEPKNDADLVGHCNKFTDVERCVRTLSKDCLQGIHRTSASAVASATKRFQKQECKNETSRAKYIEPLKCAMKLGKDMVEVYRNHTAMLQGIRDLDLKPEEKFMKVCCLLNNLDLVLETRYNQVCPKSTSLILGIVHAMTDDARSTLCLAPKCSHALDKVAKTQYKPPQNFIEPVMQILFELNTE